MNLKDKTDKELVQLYNDCTNRGNIYNVQQVVAKIQINSLNI